jgi:type IV pilus assembly protein PilB
VKTRPKILGQLLVDAGWTTPAELASALEEQRSSGCRIGVILARRGATTEEHVAEALALQLGLPFAAEPLEPERAALRAVRPELARSRTVLPLRVVGRALHLAMCDPLDLDAVDDLGFQTGKRIEACVSTPSAIAEGLARSYGGDLTELVAALPSDLRDVGPDRSALVQATSTAPVVRLVDRLLRHAIDRGASDIHVEEMGEDVRVRYRIDGILEQALDLPAAARPAILSRLKVMAGMDISVKRRAQDGRIPLDHAERALTLRVSTLPVNGGEKAVVRILDPDAAPRGFDALGFAPKDLSALRRMLAAGEGVILVAGPTGCGKSTTIFGALSELDRERQNVVTLEDPVEYRLPGANQIQVDRRAGLGFSEALRAVLRQDPDVVMVGEIRDRETAEIAMSAAVTGHLVLSTIHTTDAPGAITRLLHMGVPPFLVAGGLAGVVAQRLVRRVCVHCRGAGCRECGDGYRGRTGIFQVLTLTDPLRDAISRDEPSARLRALAREAGLDSLAADARRALAEGLTTPHEITRLLKVAEGLVIPCASCDAGVPLGALACPACGRPRARSCSCGHRLEGGWRFCPWCIRPVAA